MERPVSLREWLKSPEVIEQQKMAGGELMSQSFFRDPFRTVIYDPDVLYSPADGVVLYARECAWDDFLEVKGTDWTLRDMLADETYKQRSLVVGVFMTSYSVHLNRVPASVFYLERRMTDKITTHNVSMLMVEHELLDDLKIDKDALGYLHSNEKVVSVFHCPRIRGRIYTVQVGDKDIDTVLNWSIGKHLLQGQRFGQIRWGSQTDMIVPLDGRTKYEILVKPLDYVKAGLTPVVKIVSGKKGR